MLLSMSILTSAKAQFGNGNSKEIQQLKQTKTLVVLGYDAEYNKAIQAAVKKYWTFTEYDFIAGPSYKKYCGNSDYSFIMLYKIKDYAFTSDFYHNIGVSLGGSCEISNYKSVAYGNMIPMKHYKAETECVRAIQMMQQFLEMGSKEKIAREDDEKLVDLYSASKDEVQKKILYINENDILPEFSSLRKVKELYKFEVRVVDAETIEKVILEQRENAVVYKLAFVSRGYRYHIVAEAKGGKILFGMQAKKKEQILTGPKFFARLSE